MYTDAHRCTPENYMSVWYTHEGVSTIGCILFTKSYYDEYKMTGFSNLGGGPSCNMSLIK